MVAQTTLTRLVKVRALIPLPSIEALTKRFVGAFLMPFTSVIFFHVLFDYGYKVSYNFCYTYIIKKNIKGEIK